METIFLYSAVVGGSFLLLQTLMMLLGGDADSLDAGDVPLDAGDLDAAHLDPAADAHDAFLKLLSLKTIVAFLTFFGLAGLACREAGMTAPVTIGVAIGAGVASVFVVAHLMALLTRLQSSGNVDLRNAVGTRAKVYLRIPAGHGGSGRVLVDVQGRTVECRAVTGGSEIRTGAEVRVTDLRGADTVEVVPAAE